MFTLQAQLRASQQQPQQPQQPLAASLAPSPAAAAAAAADALRHVAVSIKGGVPPALLAPLPPLPSCGTPGTPISSALGKGEICLASGERVDMVRCAAPRRATWPAASPPAPS